MDDKHWFPLKVFQSSPQSLFQMKIEKATFLSFPIETETTFLSVNHDLHKKKG